ncbi:hypothetical protein CBR56_02960 [Bacillus thuringiensis]|uniref:hypothetical protein n=1 Tax=Bacillus tropicus TaxID=2026188 RepID=UPI000B434BEC|nr:hypothetical protein [Bacillus tropicus]MED3034572.1 hypothetical protein [Bacillus tropicus]OTX83064.1 hypothetical protein BK728_16070 [Bacillus thuringiensis serovar chanpaisis]PNK34489.1 hypothetical protein CBR56_02960 [Bacillus thuringiensis]
MLEWPDSTPRVIRLATVVCYDQNDKEIKVGTPDLINNIEFHEEDKNVYGEIKSYVSKELNGFVGISKIIE